jgi:hypothetical protein
LVTSAGSGLGVQWQSRQRTILELAEARFVTAPLDLPPDGEVLICCAAPDDDLVLDV